MPQKTRKEKIAAQKRRTSFSYSITETSSIKTENVSEEVKETYTESKEDNLIKKFFFADLRKSLMLSGAILALEIFLYFVRIG